METQFLSLSQRAILLTVLVSAPPIVAALVVGLILATLQALTQIQEQTIQHAAKIGSVFLVLYVLGYWMAIQVLQYAQLIFTNFPIWVG